MQGNIPQWLIDFLDELKKHGCELNRPVEERTAKRVFRAAFIYTQSRKQSIDQTNFAPAA
jgi:hypothetical protein